MNSDSKYEDKPKEVFPTDEFVKVCEELGLLEPAANEIAEDMWNDIPEFGEDNMW